MEEFLVSLSQSAGKIKKPSSSEEEAIIVSIEVAYLMSTIW